MPGVIFGASSGWVSGPGCRIYAEHGRACDEVELCKEATRSPVQSKQAQAESWPMLVFNSLPLARETRSSPARSLFRALNLVSGSGRSGREGFGSVVARKQSSAHRASDKPILTQWNTDQLRTGRVHLQRCCMALSSPLSCSCRPLQRHMLRQTRRQTSTRLPDNSH